MEKMGWSKGKGLGANEDGRVQVGRARDLAGVADISVQHVSVKQKDNNKGVGFEGQDDTWLAHQSDFQVLTTALHCSHLTWLN